MTDDWIALNDQQNFNGRNEHIPNLHQIKLQSWQKFTSKPISMSE